MIHNLDHNILIDLQYHLLHSILDNSTTLSYLLIFNQQKCISMANFLKVQPCNCFFFYQGFLHRHWRFTGQQEKGGDHLLFHSTTSSRSRTLRHLLATLHVRWLSHIFNRTTCIYQAATRWDLQPYWITIWLTDDVTLSFWLLTRRFDSSFFVTAIWDGKPLDSNSHLLSPLYYKRTD